jgi:predicted RNase H-like HicB family nuclease
MDFAVVIERQGKSFGAYVPDLPGCAVVGRSRREVQSGIRKAIAMYVDDMIQDGEPVPKPSASVMWVARPARKSRAR